MAAPELLPGTNLDTTSPGDGSAGWLDLIEPKAPAGMLDETARAQVYRLSRMGASVEVLAEQYGLSRSGLDRVINEVRAHRFVELKLDFVPDPTFDDPEAAAAILGPVPDSGDSPSPRRGKAPEGLPPYLVSLYDAPLLTREQEAHLFRKMNYLKFLAVRLRDRIDPADADESDLDEVERLLDEALTVKNQIIRSNLRLVVSIAKRHVGSSNSFFELVSDGNMALIRAVEKFDQARGFKFSTYASWAIMRNYSRTIPEERNRRDRFVTGHEAMFEAAPDTRSDEREQETTQGRIEDVVARMLGRLSDRERRVLVSRFGLGGVGAQTLEQLGREFGVTKERVRQIEARAQEKLRKFVREQKIELHAS